MTRILAVLLLLAAGSAAATDESSPPVPRNPAPMPVLLEGATPELDVLLTPATAGFIPLDRAQGDRPFRFHVFVYTPDHEGMLGHHELILRPGENKRLDRKLSGDLRLRATVALAADGLVRYAVEVLVKDRIAARTSAALRPGWPAAPAGFRPAPSY